MKEDIKTINFSRAPTQPLIRTFDTLAALSDEGFSETELWVCLAMINELEYRS